MKSMWLWMPLGVVGVALFVLAGGEAVRQLWNWLMPSLFGWSRITFWQALGVLALCRILFGGFGKGGGYHGPVGRGHRRQRSVDQMADQMADRVAERWGAMSAEERERFRQRVREQCGFDPAG